ncbi:DMT family transporter [Altericroceibacterium xinjiangense]|uniref:DMT family transporter n=1 Tax=Altericroceibacterium xinjiangense TaxID=762261 RepID=UPI001F49BD1A|nr:DMT family transporter [Altericroceibacterium xinjiangense]
MKVQQNDRSGLLFALAGFCTLSIGDAIVKGMTGMWSPAAMAATRYVLAAAGLSAFLVAQQGIGALRMPKPGLQWVRGLAVSVASIAMFLAVWLMPLAEATTITFTQPMITAILAAIFLNERLRLPTIVATLVAFCGVVLVLRPNFEAVGLGALLPLIAAAGMAMLMIANRAVAGAAGVLAMQVYVALTASVLLVIASVAGHLSGVDALRLHWPEWSVLARLAFIAVSATVAHYLIYMGTVRAGAATVAPMTYGQLLVAVVIGWWFFGNTIDLVTMLGAAIIIGAGLYLWWQGRVKEPPENP